MTDTPATVQGQLPATDSTQVLQRIFTGHVVGGPGFPGTYLATVVSATDFDCVVTIEGFDGSASFTCHHEPHFEPSSPSTPYAPPAGTTCIVCFPANDPNRYGYVLMFRGFP